jgi:UTP:GlnB (protein PII) uridylyltransferase
MPNRNLTSDELKRANELLADIRERLTGLAAGDPLLLFAYRRKVAKELQYDERGKPGHRGKLKAMK